MAARLANSAFALAFASATSHDSKNYYDHGRSTQRTRHQGLAQELPEWDHEKKHIERTFEFDEFSEAIDFVNSVAEIAEEDEHHPEIDIRYNKVKLTLSTHSEGGLTEVDFELAEKIDTLVEG